MLRLRSSISFVMARHRWNSARRIHPLFSPRWDNGEMAFLRKGIASATVVAKDIEVVGDAIYVSDLRLLIDTFPGPFLSIV